MIQQLKFSTNPNGKLFLDIFGDVRLYDDAKFRVGKILEPTFKNSSLGYVEIIAVRVFKYSHIRDVFSFLNCGKHPAYQASLLQKFYPEEAFNADTRLMHIVFQYTTRNLTYHQELLKEWWEVKIKQQPNTQTFKNEF